MNTQYIYLYATHYTIGETTSVSRRFTNHPEWEYKTLNKVNTALTQWTNTVSNNICAAGTPVTECNRFLFECDELFINGEWKHIDTDEELELALEQQKLAINSIPGEFRNSIESITYSGNKSYHVVLLTSNSMLSNEENAVKIYKQLHAILANKIFNGLTYKPDTAVAEPHRLTRNQSVANVKTNRIQQTMYFNHCATAYDVGPIVSKLKNDIKNEEYFRELRAKHNAAKWQGKGNYHNLPAVKAAMKATTGERDTLTCKALYSMKNNGYTSEIRDFLDEIRWTIGDEVYSKYINDQRWR